MSFQQIVMVVNRTTVPLEVMENGMVWVIPPSYRHDENGQVVGAGPHGALLETPLPLYVAERAKRHNPIMGTSDPFTPGRCQFLIAVPAWGDDASHAEQSGAIEILDRSQLPEAEVVRVIGGRKTTSIPGRREAGQRQHLRTDDLVDTKMDNPVGIETK